MDRTAASMLFKDVVVGGLFYDSIGKGIGFNSEEVKVTIYEKVSKSNGNIVKADWAPRQVGVTHRFSPFQRVWVLERLPDYDTRQGLKAKEANMDKIAAELVKVAKSLMGTAFGDVVVMQGRDEAILKEAVAKAKQHFLDYKAVDMSIVVTSFDARFSGGDRFSDEGWDLDVRDVKVRIDDVPASIRIDTITDYVFDALDRMNVDKQVSMEISDLADSKQAIDMIVEEFKDIQIDSIPVTFPTWKDRSHGKFSTRDVETTLSVSMTLKRQGNDIAIVVDEDRLKDDVIEYIDKNYTTDDVDTD